jgi:hypothetical protein
MKHILSGLLLLAFTATPAAAADAPQRPAASRFQGLFVDWSDANRDSIEAERIAAQRPAAGPSDAPAGTAAGSVALGERVGDIVATGDCAEGERIARAAGDFALVAAVREHCAAADRR